MRNKYFYISILLTFVASILLLIGSILTKPTYLTFSDAAKYADVAKNLVVGNGYSTSFSFFTESGMQSAGNEMFSAVWIQPLYPYLVAFFFSIFGVSDFTVHIVSILLFLAMLFAVYMLSSKLFGRRVGILSSLAVGTSHQLLELSTNAGNEIAFMAIYLLGLFFATLSGKKGIIGIIAASTLLLITRPHAPVYIVGIIIFYLLQNRKLLTRRILLASAFVMALVILFANNLISQALIAIVSNANTTSPSEVLRGAEMSLSLNGDSVLVLGKKVIYNLYNFYRLLPQIMSPYLFAFAFLGIFTLSNKDTKITSYKLSALILFAFVLLTTALTIPFYRYIYPVIPVIYILAVACVISLSRQLNRNLSYSLPVLMIILFVTGQTLGIILLDSRFSDHTNKNKPPIYVEHARRLRGNTIDSDVILTNLDTWGSWYGERKTVWFPLDPSMVNNANIKFDYIYLTDYKIDDENYYMNDNWRSLLNNPENHGIDNISTNYELVGEYAVSAEDTYEGQMGRAVLYKLRK